MLPITRITPPTETTPAPRLETRVYGFRALSPNYRYLLPSSLPLPLPLQLYRSGKRLLTSFVGENRHKPAMAEGLKSTPAGRSAPPSARKMRTSRETSWGGGYIRRWPPRQNKHIVLLVVVTGFRWPSSLLLLLFMLLLLRFQGKILCSWCVFYSRNMCCARLS